jgi:hypothetical protein
MVSALAEPSRTLWLPVPLEFAINLKPALAFGVSLLTRVDDVIE